MNPRGSEELVIARSVYRVLGLGAKESRIKS